MFTYLLFYYFPIGRNKFKFNFFVSSKGAVTFIIEFQCLCCEGIDTVAPWRKNKFK